MLQGFSEQSLWYQRACGCLPCSQRCPCAWRRVLGRPRQPRRRGRRLRRASVNPARIERVRTELPNGFEVAALSARAAPVAFWGLGSAWAADPPRCLALADPVAAASTTRGWSASGAGGIVYAVVAGSAATLDPSLLDECGQWTVSAGHTIGSVAFVGGAPDRRRRDRRPVHRDHHRRRGWHRNPFACGHFHRLSGRLHRVRHRRQRSWLAESCTRTGFRGGIAGENRVGITRLSGDLRVHWRRCRTRGRCLSLRAQACWPHARPDIPQSRTSRTPTSPTSRTSSPASGRSSRSPAWGRRASTPGSSGRRRCRQA